VIFSCRTFKTLPILPVKITQPLKNSKVMFGHVFDYAVINEIIPKDRNMVEYLNIKDAGNPNTIDRLPFTNAEIDRVWKNVECDDYK
jgi:hypothetical protein